MTVYTDDKQVTSIENTTRYTAWTGITHLGTGTASVRKCLITEIIMVATIRSWEALYSHVWTMLPYRVIVEGPISHSEREMKIIPKTRFLHSNH